MSRILALALLLLVAHCARAASPVVPPASPAELRASPGLDRDLGQGLVYHRVHHLPADLPTAERTRRQPCVLDLRYVSGEAEAAAALAAWMKFRATARAPVFILANPDTSPALLAPFTGPHPGASVVVIGGAAPGFTPDIAVKISPEIERQAYDALEIGVAIESLLTENSDKLRHDEAKLAKDRRPESTPADETPEARPIDGEDASKPKAPPPLIDAALQRAVQLHRTLLALKKL